MKKLLVPIICASAVFLSSCNSSCNKKQCKDSVEVSVDTNTVVKVDSLAKDSVK